LLDESLERHINDLARLAAPAPALPDPTPSTSITGTTGPSKSAPSPGGNVGSTSTIQPSAPPPEDAFQIGDRVRLRPGKTGSSVAALKAGKAAGSMYCGRPIPKPGTGTCSESGPHCASCSACAALGVKETKAASDHCLGTSKDGREGVVQAVKSPPIAFGGAPARLVRVVSVHTGHVCFYASEDLMYADGSLPGADPAIPFLESATKARPTLARAGAGGSGGANLPADWGAAYMSKVEVSSDAGSNGPQVLVDGNGGTFWQSNGRQGTHFVQVTLDRPRPLADFAIVVDEGDGNYCPRTVRVFAGPSAAALSDLGSQPLPLGGGPGPRKYTLLKDFKTAVSVIKVVVEDSGGGCDCKVHGVTVAAAAQARRSTWGTAGR
jgi:hypothetical protein